MKTKQYITIIMLLCSISAFAEKTSKLDSLLNLVYNNQAYPTVLAEVKKQDKKWGAKLDSAIQFMFSIPGSWAMAAPYQQRMNIIQYRRLPAYALLVEEEYEVHKKIDQQYPLLIKQKWPGDDGDPTRVKTLKPVIYLYPEKEQAIDIGLDFTGSGLYTYPKINTNNHWNITALPNGMLTDNAGNNYPYLFWEGVQADMSYINFSEGFVVEVAQLETFLEEKLTLLGLNARERTDFITYWAPKQQESTYVFVRFETQAYSKAVPLTINPAPQSIQRIFTVFMPVEKGYLCQPQVLEPFNRKGYTVIEWGGVQMPQIVD